MSFASNGHKPPVAGFRTRLFAALMLIIAGLTALGLFFGQRNIAANVERDLQQNFQAELTALHKLQELRDSALAERCRSLGEKPRIHAALEDNALDLLYASAQDELRDLMQQEEPLGEQATTSLHARFYRFLDSAGTVLPPPNPKDVGELAPDAEAELNLKKLPESSQIGYLAEHVDRAHEIFDEVIAVPIFSTETGEVISALVVGFKSFEPASKGTGAGMKSGIWVNGRLHLPSASQTAQDALANQIANAVSKSDRSRNNFTVTIDGAPHFLFFKRLNPDSIFPPAYEICVYPLADSIAQLHRLRWKIGSAGVLLLLGGFVVSQFAVARLSKPVEQLVVESEHDRADRKRAEEALASATEELERSTRYSADASHQLKSPVTVLRAGIETLLNREDFKPEVHEELSMMLHQTHRLTGVIDDLLLLARMDAGHLQIKSEPVNLSQLIEEWLDDLSALPDAPDVKIEKQIPAELYVAGERQYTSLIVQNLLENARKYNRSGGKLRVEADEEGKQVALRIGNTGRPIAQAAQQNIFERFHRDKNTSAVSGHGLGLNLARELMRLHGGDLRLVGSADDWTEFEAQFRIARRTVSHQPQVA
jgi:signal transduction histidine kinase